MQKVLRPVIIWLVILLLFYGSQKVIYSLTNDVKEISYSTLVQSIEEGSIKKLDVTENTVNAEGTDGAKYYAHIPSREVLHTDVGEVMVAQMTDGALSYVAREKHNFNWSLAGTVLCMVALFVFFTLFMNRGGGRNGANFGKSRARLMQDSDKKVTFDMVAGAKEEKEELAELVEFLKNPQKFISLGARIPKGVLLVGSPGTGKTLIARAVAGEAGVPFFSISGSDFVEMYVGVGASRVRDLFEQAKKASPCIIFVDEIDAVGRKRGAGMGGGHDEREQTLNQLLVEMDGFGKNEGIIIIAATNRPDILDPALLRPGRFDRQVVVDLPDIVGREEILAVHAKNKPLADEVDLKQLARATAGCTGAELENILNEAAIFAARRGKQSIDNTDLADANVKVFMGPEKRSHIIKEEEKRITAYHEAGHALIVRLLSDKEQVSQISIIPRGRAGGYTMYLPEEENAHTTRGDLLTRIAVALGGRAAEAVVLDDITTGASQDIKQATQLAREMVTKLGMSESVGLVCYDEGGEVFLGRDFGHSKAYSEDVASEIDREVKRIIETQYKTAVGLLQEHRAKLDAVAAALLEYETIDGSEFNKIFEKTA